MGELLDFQALGLRGVAYRADVVRHDHEIQIKAHHRLRIGVDGEPPDEAVGGICLVENGQQKLDESADDSFLVWAKDRFPPRLRVHLAATNIRDVVHKRLLQKSDDAARQLRDLFDKHRADLKHRLARHHPSPTPARVTPPPRREP